MPTSQTRTDAAQPPIASPPFAIGGARPHLIGI